MAQRGLLPATWRHAAFAASLAATPSLCQAASEKVVFAFASHGTGNLPDSALVRIGGKLYGTTAGGGTYGSGTIYFVQPNGRHVVLYNFKGGTDGWFPTGGLVQFGGLLYGVTYNGGGTGQGGLSYGTVFSITPQGAFKQIYAFQGTPDDGSSPASGLVVLGNLLYGTTSGGGASGNGTVFSITPQGAETLLYSFHGNPDGASPSSLMTDGQNLYGTTGYGAGTDCDYNGCGTIFMVDPQGNETTLHTFGNGNKGGNPYSPLLKLSDQLYGGTSKGGTYNLGTVFRMSLTGAYTDLHDFTGADGTSPGSLIESGGTLYGTTGGGGANNDGTVFTLTKTGALTTIYNFQGGGDGAYPGNLLAVDATLYGETRGLTEKCGKADPPDCGTVFAVTP